ncbi:MAG TPA: hypothetical protein VMR96_06790 [Solirubrobacterales bacterium]|nr:hypothetical protein [Solirubrobacterales bacterium]
MRLFGTQTKRPRLGGTGMELAGALSIASQMALLAPPGFDELIRRELTGEAEGIRRQGQPRARIN